MSEHLSTPPYANVEDATVILVVEDEEAIRCAVSELLEAEGYAVIGASDGEEALMVVAQTTPALVLTDLQMPHVDGYELCKRLREATDTCDVPLVVFTANNQTVDLPVQAVLRKPFDVDTLLAIVAEYIRRTVPPVSSLVTSSGRHRSLPAPPHALVLYVSSGSAACVRAERSLRGILESDIHEDARPALEIVDVTRDPARAAVDGVVITPTLVRSADGRRALFVGDLTDAKVLRAFLMRLD